MDPVAFTFLDFWHIQCTCIKLMKLVWWIHYVQKEQFECVYFNYSICTEGVILKKITIRIFNPTYAYRSNFSMFSRCGEMRVSIQGRCYNNIYWILMYESVRMEAFLTALWNGLLKLVRFNLKKKKKEVKRLGICIGCYNSCQTNLLREHLKIQIKF